MSQGQLDEQKVNEAVQAIGKKAATDNAFRELCLKDPKAAVKEATGVELHEEFNLRFVENAGADLTLVLPDYQEASANAELSDEELEEVSGGILVAGAATLLAAGTVMSTVNAAKKK